MRRYGVRRYRPPGEELVPVALTERVAEALRMAESVLLARGQETARHNAWAAVRENERLAQDREEAERVFLQAVR